MQHHHSGCLADEPWQFSRSDPSPAHGESGLSWQEGHNAQIQQTEVQRNLGEDQPHPEVVLAEVAQEEWCKPETGRHNEDLLQVAKAEPLQKTIGPAHVVRPDVWFWFLRNITVGAVYDRACHADWPTPRAVIDRAYS